MRLLCITLGIGILIWLLQSPPEMVWVGFLITASMVGARLAHRAKLPNVLGMIAAGLAIGFAPITTAESHQSIKPFADIAMAWVGLYLGTSLSRPIFANQRLLTGSIYLYAAPVLTTFSVLIFFDLHLVTHLATCHPIGHLSPHIFRSHRTQPARHMAFFFMCYGNRSLFALFDRAYFWRRIHPERRVLFLPSSCRRYRTGRFDRCCWH